MSAPEERLRVLRMFTQRGWQNAVSLGIQSAREYRNVNWLIARGWLESHPERFLTDFRITDAGFEVLAMAGGDVTGTGW